MTDPYAKLLNRQEIAELLGVSPTTVDRLKNKRAIPFIKMATGSVRYRYKDVLAALEKYTVKELRL